MSIVADCKANLLLAALTDAEFVRWRPHLECIGMPLDQILYEPGDIMRHVYFPTTAIASLLYVLEDGCSAESAVVGNEGIVGSPVFMGGESTLNCAIVQSGAGDFG